MYPTTKRAVLLTAGILSLGLGVAGIFLPLVPTTPFILLAAFFFSRSSERLHQWLLNHPRLGPVITDWERSGVIRLRVKIIATVTMMAAVSYPLFFMEFAGYLKGMVVLSILGVLVFIWTRPSQHIDHHGDEPQRKC